MSQDHPNVLSARITVPARMMALFDEGMGVTLASGAARRICVFRYSTSSWTMTSMVALVIDVCQFDGGHVGLLAGNQHRGRIAGHCADVDDVVLGIDNRLDHLLGFHLQADCAADGDNQGLGLF